MRIAPQVRIAAVIAILAWVPAGAATFCAKDSQALKVALAAAQANGEDDMIMLGWGTFEPPGASFSVQSNEANSLIIAGGFFTAPGFAPCAFQAPGAGFSTLDGVGTKAPLDIQSTSVESSLVVSNLTVQNGVSVGSAPPLRVQGAGLVALERVVVRANQTDTYAAEIVSTNGRVQVRNSAFVSNGSTAPNTRAVLVSANAGVTPAVVFNNNTVSANFGSAGMEMGGVRFAGSGDMAIGNNVIWGNGSTDLVAQGTGNSTVLSNNDYGTFSGAATLNVNALHVNPGFLAAGDFRLHPNSPLRDAGANGVLGDIGEQDVTGGARVVFDSVDIGAYEIPDRIFLDDFEQAGVP